MKTETSYNIENAPSICSPALIYYPDIIEENIIKTIAMAGSPERLWPHVKSHKMSKMVDLQISHGITKFKCATIAELEMVCGCGASAALLAYPILGPSVEKYLSTVSRHPGTVCYAVGESHIALNELNKASCAHNLKAKWLCDVNMGLDRTGVRLDELADFCFNAVKKYDNLEFMGFHCYDGQNHQKDPKERQKAVDEQFSLVLEEKRSLEMCGINVPVVITGGSPTFPCYASKTDVFLSPGTVFTWDWGYQTGFPDLNFTPGAVLMTRVISRPAHGVFTLDLGYKAIASDPNGQRGIIVEYPDAVSLFQNEEHWVWKMPENKESECPEIGDVLYVIPKHICPTSALYRAAIISRDGAACGEWTVDARNRD